MAIAQQIADTSYNPEIPMPEYEKGKGPVIFIDEGHYNFHTKDGRYTAFAKLLERGGYNVKAYSGMLEKEKLKAGKILVISNALNSINAENWYLPTPSAFTTGEIEIVRQWVNNGGSLFLIADHMPMAGAAADLAKVFGFQFSNGFAFDTLTDGPAIFSIKGSSLVESVIITGRNKSERVEQIASFTGQAFKIPADAQPILVFDKRYMNYLPDTAWVIENKTPRHSVAGWCQGAYKKYGKGKVVVFGEAAMFTAQLAGREQRKMGMNSDVAKENYKLLLNIIHWLDNKF